MLFKRSALVALSLAVLSACSPSAEEKKAEIQAILSNDASMAYAAYSDSVTTAQQLQSAIETLVKAPTDTHLSEAKSAWIKAREPYGQTEVYRFREGPIDALKGDGTLGTEGDGPEGEINAWPLGEALIDYVAATPPIADGVDHAENFPAVNASIIADTSIPLNGEDLDSTIETLAAFQEANGDEANVATGYHAIEFLLWGQDLNQGQAQWGKQRDNSPGQRPVSDYAQNEQCTVDAQGNTDSSGKICQRRAIYLRAVAQKLVDDLSRVRDAWAPQSPLRQQYIDGGKHSLASVLESMGRLSFGELAGERINIALTQDSQEDEHSCFSDNTHRDILLNAKGIQNSYLGQYGNTTLYTDATAVSGDSIDALLRKRGHTELAKQLKGALAHTQSLAQAIDQTAQSGTPFDQQIAGGEIDPKHPKANQTIRDLIQALVAQTELIEQAIAALELTADDLRQDTEESI
ncbi:insulin-cleaving metalloproteinase outer membrane protein [gamma proteobacterium HTCC5015]|nr:insulin-cleaving metalloproteinase outer membrane protein [gamma proteobacterium HTCC5015]